MMTCRQFAELLIDFLSGELSPDHSARLHEHLKRCPPCVVYLETYQLTIKLTRRLPCEPLPDHLAQRLHTMLAQARQEQPPQGDSACS
jgi:anti-sigma factor RsiW